MKVDHRSMFFLLAAVVCALLALVAGPHAWVALSVAGLYLLLAAGSWLDHCSRTAGQRDAGPRLPGDGSSRTGDRGQR